MGRVNLEILPWITAACGYEKSGRLLLEEEVEEGATIGDLLHQVAERDPTFGEVVFDRTKEAIHGYISIVLNERILGQTVGLDTVLKDGDTVKLLPTIDGG